MNCMMLFGAGASFGSGPTRPSVIPLGKGLYDALVAFSTAWADLPVDADATFKSVEGFEAGMAWVRESHSELVIPLVREMSCYFLQFRPDPGNVYIDLINELRKQQHRTAIATLNYDVLLDMAICYTGNGTINYQNPYEQDLAVLKLHGAPNILPDMRGLKLSDVRMSNWTEAAVEAPMKYSSYAAAVDLWSKDRGVAPSMALYSPTKEVIVTPRFVKAIQTEYAEALKVTEHLAICGAAYMPHDEHIWNPIISSPAVVTIVDPCPANFEALRDVRLGQTNLRCGVFSDFLADVRSGLF